MAIITIPFGVLLLLVFGYGGAQQVSNQPVLICSVDTAASIRQYGTKFTAEDLDPNLCTHIIYNKAAVDPENHDIIPKNPSVDFYEGEGLGLYNKTMKLKEVNPQLKIILQICCMTGAFWENSTLPSEMIVSKFSKNAAKYLLQYGFDGLYFNLEKYIAENQMIQSLREEFNNHDLLLVTIKYPLSVPGLVGITLTKDLSEEFDMVLVADHWAVNPFETRIFSDTARLRKVVSDYKKKGISGERLVVPIPTFSITYRLCNESDTGESAAICDGGNEGRTESAEMMLTYSEMMYKMRNDSEGWVVQRDNDTGVLYGHSNSLLWSSFEDQVSARAKVQYALEEKLAGVAVMTVDTDDIEGYNKEGIKLPLTTAIHDALRGSQGEESTNNL